MKSLVKTLLHHRPLVVLAVAAWIGGGVYFLRRLDIEAYPDPTPPIVEFITQNPSWSAEEMEQQVTIPVETALFGIRDLQYVRSITLFGLSDIKLYFSYHSNYYTDRQLALDRLQWLTLPDNLTPQFSWESPLGEIYRFRMEGPGYSLNELTATARWFVRRELLQVPGIVDMVIFGGTTRQYQAIVNPQKLLQYDVSLPQVQSAIAASNANVGGNYLSLGSQSVNIRGIGLLHTLQAMRHIVLADRNGVPVLLGDVATVRKGFQPRLGQVGMDHDNDIIEGIALMRRGGHSLAVLRTLKKKIASLNHGLLPPGMRLATIYDRTNLIHITTHTVRDLVIFGLTFVTVLLLLFLGDLRISMIAALSIPLALLFAFTMMVLTGQSANLISIGAIDFGILLDATVIDLEHIHRRLRTRREDEPVNDVIAEAMSEASRPVLFSVAIILVAFLPLFTMEGVPGKIFSPMSITYGYALIGGRLFALFFAPALASFGAESARERGLGETHLVRWLRKGYARVLPWALKRRWVVLGASGLALVAGLSLVPLLGGEFIPHLEEGDIWMRITLPQDVSIHFAAGIAKRVRNILLSYPEVTHVISQMGRPDDGTDVVTFNNIEFYVPLKPRNQWPAGMNKHRLVREMDARLERLFPGAVFGFSQYIEDNVNEAMSGVKGENSLKLFGNNLNVLAAKARQIRNVMATVHGITDLGIFKETGQPDLDIAVDRSACARYGLLPADVNDAVQAAIGGEAVTQILQGDRRFDFVVRYPRRFRDNPQAVRNLILIAPDGAHVPLGQVASVGLQDGAFMIYRENGRRYIPIKFSVRGRDLSGTMAQVQRRLMREVKLPRGYFYKWSGEFESLLREEHRLEIIVPITLVIIFCLLYVLFDSWREALVVMVTLPFGAIGGVLVLFFTGTPFSISAAVGFISALGVGTLAASVFLSGIRRAVRTASTHSEAIREGALVEMRPIMMACLAAAIGLLPAAVSHGIGSQAQRPLARVVVGAMITTTLAILFLIPALETLIGRFETPRSPEID